MAPFRDVICAGNVVINSISAQRFHCLLMPACSRRQSAESSGTLDACREKSFRLPQGDAKKARGGRSGETRRAVTLPRTPDSTFYFLPHVLFRGHFVPFGSSLRGLIAQLMSGDDTCLQTSSSCFWSFVVEFEFLDKRNFKRSVHCTPQRRVRNCPKC